MLHKFDLQFMIQTTYTLLESHKNLRGKTVMSTAEPIFLVQRKPAVKHVPNTLNTSKERKTKHTHTHNFIWFAIKTLILKIKNMNYVMSIHYKLF